MMGAERFIPRYLPPSGIDLTFADLALALGGDARERFRIDLRRRFGLPHVLFASSGRAALVRLFCAMGQLRPGRDEILLPSYTSFSVPAAAVRAGFRVSLYDLDAQTLSPDLRSLERGINDGTLCIVLCHLFGYPADAFKVEELAAQKGIYLLDDAAQAMGACLRGRPIGSFGDAGLLSFSRGKPMTTVDGGAILTRSHDLAREIAEPSLEPVRYLHRLNLFGKGALFSLMSRPSLYWMPRRLPFLKIGTSVFSPVFPLQEYTAFQASLGYRLNQRLDEVNAMRRRIAAKWIEALQETGAIFPRVLNGAEPIYLRLPLLNGAAFPRRPQLGIVSSYPHPLHRLEALRPHLTPAAREGAFPGADELCQLQTLPTHREVHEEVITSYLEHVFSRSPQPDRRGPRGRAEVVKGIRP